MTHADDPYKRGPQELEAMTLDELLDSMPLKPWDQDDPDPLVQKAIRLSGATAPADLGADDHLHDDALGRLDFPADGQASGGPRTCLTHVVGEVNFAVEDDGGRLSRLTNGFFSRLRKMCL
jgi:hypothetical protein